MVFFIASNMEVHQVDDSGISTKHATLDHTPQSIAALGDVIVFTHASNSSVLQVGEKLIDLPSNSYALTVFNHTIYAVCDMSIVAVDPLSWATVVIPTQVQLEEIRGRGMWMVGRATDKVFHSVKLDSFVGQCLDVSGTFAPTGPTIHSNKGTWLEVSVEGALVPCEPYQGLPLGGGKFVRVEEDGAVLVSNGSKTTIFNGPNLILLPRVDAEEMCPVCFDDNAEGESVTLPCGHAFHIDCLQSWMGSAEKYITSGDHITFNSAMCPAGCGALVRHTLAPRSEVIAARLKSINTQVEKIQQQIGFESKTSGDLLFYHCCRCAEPFYGGGRVCPRMTPNEPQKLPTELVCDECNPMRCSTHGSDLLVRKCRFCDEPATDRSFGCIYHCEECGKGWSDATIPHAAESTEESAKQFHVLYCAGCKLD